MAYTREFRPITGYKDLEELKGLGRGLFEILQNSRAHNILEGRGLNGVLKRHGGSANQSAGQMVRARKEAQEQGLTTFLTFDGDNRFVGMATIQRELELRRQVLPVIPTRIQRRAHLLQRVPGIADRSHVFAWDVGEGLGRPLHAAYSHLRETTDGYCWTVEPLAAGGVGWTAQTIESAGFELVDASHRYDDGEVVGMNMAPYMALLMSDEL